ncbi:putative exoglucanase GH6D [Colletotrichum sp. SAR 10_96]|nr:putative exoglucanase GH6D [Colletotrichum sp. SAR 10_96]
MPSLTSSLLLALAATTLAHPSPSRSKADLDPAVWSSLANHHPAPHAAARSLLSPQTRNRPTKRQSGFSPPSSLTAPLKEVWAHYESTYDGAVTGNKYWGWDQLVATNGSLNICVRWDSSATVTAAQRSKIASAYAAQYQKWFKWLYGYDGFPFAKVDVNVVAWAVKDASLLEGSTDGLDVYTTYKDGDGVPACATECDRAAHIDGDFSGCKAGADRRFEHSLWLTDGLEGGFGYDWGQQIGREYMINNLDSESIHILLHEMGHTFGLDDFYDWTPTGVSNFIMLAGSSMEITDFDGWMYRNWWYELSRSRGWTKASSATTPAATASASTSASAAPAVKEDVAEEVSEPAASSTSVAAPAATSAATESAAGASAAKWAQCGGAGYTGPTACAAGSTCTKSSEWYSQCL